MAYIDRRKAEVAELKAAVIEAARDLENTPDDQTHMLITHLTALHESVRVMDRVVHLVYGAAMHRQDVAYGRVETSARGT